MPDEIDTVVSLVSKGLDKVFLTKSTFPPAKHHRLTKSISMDRIAASSKGVPNTGRTDIQFSSSGKERSKGTNLLLKLKNRWRSEVNIVISPPIQDNLIETLPCNTAELGTQSCAQQNTGLYRLDRRKSLSTGNLAGMSEALQISKPSFFSLNAQSASPLVLPEVPKRSCSFVENCTVDDEYLRQKGEQLRDSLNMPCQRWSDPTHAEVEDLEPDYDSPTDDFEPLYDIPHSFKAGVPRSASSDQASSHYVNSGIKAEDEKTTFNGSQIHTYDTPKPLGDPAHSSFFLTAASIANEMYSDCEDDPFNDYVDMFHGLGMPSDQNPPSNPPALPPRSPRMKKAPAVDPLAATHPPLQQRDRPWSSHFTNAPPALPPWPASLARGPRRSRSSAVHPPPLVPCNSFDGSSIAPQAHISSSTSTPCLYTGPQPHQKNKTEEGAPLTSSVMRSRL